jgi:hypothetical protein
MDRSFLFSALVSGLCLLGGWALCVKPLIHAAPTERVAESTTGVADSLLLDQYPNAHVAYSLRKLRSDYSGPAVRVRRSSDDAEQDIGFDGNGMLDTAALTSFVGSGDGYVTTWYSQVEGEPNLTQQWLIRQPTIVDSGAVVTVEGDPTMRFSADGSEGDELNASASPIPYNDYTYMVVGKDINFPSNAGIPDVAGFGRVKYRAWDSFLNDNDVKFGDQAPRLTAYTFLAVRNDGTEANGFQGNGSLTTVSGDPELDDPGSSGDVYVGTPLWEGYLSEFVVLPSIPKDEVVPNLYVSAATDWNVGPAEWNEGALLPQLYSYQVTLYDWLETIEEADLDLPSGDIAFDDTGLTDEEKAEAVAKLAALSASRVLRQHSSNLVLDDGNGGGFEGSGSVRLLHTPGGGGEDRAWENEIAWWYQLDVPGFTNPYYQNPNVARRALVLTAVDMMMYHEVARDSQKPVAATDQYGKAFEAWAYVYDHCKSILSSEVQQAFEDAFAFFLDFMLDRGPKDINTNMDMFSVRAAAHVWAATTDPTLKTKAVRAAKRILLGDPDATVGGANHDPKEGTFYPAGYIGENDSPETFYNSESYTQILGAYSAVVGEADWAWLEDILRPMSEFRVYQHFPEPTGDFLGPSAYSGRTATAMIAGQNSDIWRDLTAAYYFDEAKPLIRQAKRSGTYHFANFGDRVWNTGQDVEDLSNNSWGQTWTGTPPEWSGWESWVKSVPFLPPDGWYDALHTLHTTDDPLVQRPYEKSDTFNKLHGGPPTGPEFWSYKDADGSGNEWGFFVEALDWHGPYATMSGGSLQYFWTRDTGALIRMSQEKAGSSPNDWPNIENWAIHHVWGRDETGGGFSSAMIRGSKNNGESLDGRVATHDTAASPPYVEVKSAFNDPTAFRGGEDTGSELAGTVEVTNRFEALSDGVKVTHTLTSDESDQVNELWATIPVFLRDMRYSGNQRGLNDTTIEFWDGAAWVAMPEDTDSDGVPEYVTTTALRLGRDFGSGAQYGYVSFASSQTIRLSEQVWVRTEQATPEAERVRTVHIDLHGNPGTTKTLPASQSVSYTVQTTDPTADSGTYVSQEISLNQGWNVVSTSVSPAVPDMDSVFSGLQSEITVVENEAGERYRPGENVDEIGQWNSEEAYRIYADSDVTLTIQGDSLGSPSITLDEGWNLVPYFPSTVLSVEEALSSIVEDLSLVKDERGRAYLPEKDPDALTQMEPGEGYKIYVQQSTTLNYPDGSN